jgi:hypothetical protein
MVFPFFSPSLFLIVCTVAGGGPRPGKLLSAGDYLAGPVYEMISPDLP